MRVDKDKANCTRATYSSHAFTWPFITQEAGMKFSNAKKKKKKKLQLLQRRQGKYLKGG